MVSWNSASFTTAGQGSGDIYTFENGNRYDLTLYPPFPVVWLTAVVDVICQPLRCSNHWRNYWWSHEPNNNNNHSWWSEQYKLPALIVPDQLSLSDFWKQQEQDQQSTWTGTVHSLYKYAFETSSTKLAGLDNATGLCMLLVLWFILRQIKKILLPRFESMGRSAALRTHGAAWIVNNEIRITKFGEYVFRLLYHSLISMYGLYFFYYRDASWWYEPERTVRGYPNQDMTPAMTWYYLLQAAYNVDAMVSLLELSLDVRIQMPVVVLGKGSTKTIAFQSPLRISMGPNARGDFPEMFVHHLVTNALVFGSSKFRLTRMGIMVFMIHDVSDVPVDLSKLANFLKWKIATVICFFTMTATWLYTRLYILPFTIFKTVFFQSYYVLEEGQIPPILYVCYRPFFLLLLGLLIALHASWFLMFIQMFITLVTKYECHDYSEHKQGEAVIPSSASQKHLKSQ
jgi:hypothetical protein